MGHKGWLISGGSLLDPPTYADASGPAGLPQGPSPAIAARHPASDASGVEVSEQDFVMGRMQLVYACHCACGKRWFDPSPEQMQVCTKCGRAVLLQMN